MSMRPKANEEWFRTLDDRFWLRSDETGQDEAAFIRKALRLRRGQRVLDAPCGAGRIAICLAKAGCIVTGVDLRRTFINRAIARFRKERASGRFLAMDLRELAFEAEFDAICNWFGSFGYFSDAENADLLRRFARALRPGGRLLVDSPNREFLLRHFRAEADDGRFIGRSRWDADSQRVITARYVQGKADPRNTSSMRFCTPAQMNTLLGRAGLKIVAMYGTFDGQPYRRGSRRMIIVARRGSR